MALEQVANDHTAAIVFELVQGEGGVYPLGKEYIRKARELADRFDAILIFDEIQCGVGRTGTYFAYQLLEPVVLPDVMVTAKPMACGIPLGVVAAMNAPPRALAPACTVRRSAAGRSRAESRWNFSTFSMNCCHSSAGRQLFPHAADRAARKYSFVKEIRGTAEEPCRRITSRSGGRSSIWLILIGA